MKIALAQINTHIGNIEANARKMMDFLKKAKGKGAKLVVFPELALTGYPPKDLLEKPHFIEANVKALKDMARRVRGISAVVGFAEPNPGKKGRAVFNSAALLQKGEIKAIKRKILLPTYDVFDEARYFEPGRQSSVWEVEGARLGVSICEDIWSEELFAGRRLYEVDPIGQQARRGIDLFINISASPYSMGKEKLRLSIVSRAARRYRRPGVYVNLVGGNDDLIFDGASLVVDEQGRLCEQLKHFEEDLLVFDFKKLRPKKPAWESEWELVGEALVLGIRDYMRKCGFQKVVIGLSGGIDSSTVAALAVKACGAQNVLGVALPSPFSSRTSVRDAGTLAKRLKIDFRIIPISGIFESFQKTLQWHARKGEVDVALQNIQARIRGNILMALSNREGRLMLSTGNKSELSVGYCTLYGDLAGGLAVISDLPKTLVYRLAKHLNKIHQAIPAAVFKKPPSPELAPGQLTQDDLPPYKILDPILKMYVEENRSLLEMVKAGYPRKLVQWVIDRVDRNEYKREQAPPGLRVTSKAFGYGRRLPLTNAFRG